jgi:flagellar motility protein MotE (MotC chaperone)
MKKVRLLKIVFAVKVVIFFVWFAISFNVVELTTVYAEQSLSEGLVVTGGVNIVDVKTEALATEEDGGGIDVSTESLVTDTERSMLEAIKRRESELDYRENELEKYEQRLAVINGELDQRMKQFKATKVVVDKALVKLKAAEDKRTMRVVKIYESMAPEEAAVRIEKLDSKTAVMILSTMKEKKAGAVMGLMGVAKAVKYSQMMNKPLIKLKKKR